MALVSPVRLAPKLSQPRASITRVARAAWQPSSTWRVGNGWHWGWSGVVLGALTLRRQVRRFASEKDLEALIAECPWRRGLEPGEETEPTRLSFLGRLPADLVGTIYRNGAGRIRVGKSMYKHWFDGDGFVTALTVDGQKQEAAFTSRYVRTPRYAAQQKSEALYKTQAGEGMAMMGAWTPAANGKLLSNIFRLPTNPGNTSVIRWDDHLLALCEGGLPFVIDPGSLETLGEELFTDASGVQMFSAHPKRDPDSGQLFNMGLKIGAQPALEVFKCSTDRRLLKSATISLEALSFVHDFAITEKYVVLIIPPWVASTNGLVQSLYKGPLGQFFEWKEELGTRLLVLSKEDLSVALDKTLQPPMSFYHTVNAYDDDEKGMVRVQLAAHNGPREAVEKNFSDMYRSTWSDKTYCSVRQLDLHLSTGHIDSSQLGPASASPFELPAIHPAFTGRKNRYAFTNAVYPPEAGFLNCVERLDLEGTVVDRASFGPGQYAGEPMILPKTADASDELAAYVCTYVYDSDTHTSFMAFLDAGDLAAGPVAEVQLPSHVPYSFHGEWVPGAVDVLERASVLP
mmetsp:Transcript_2446/g.5812  ORF Transcript_2446/g.5812 Transcript_2446/m.5812 type:complete len:571 (+) Transcript_2446:47-1759(+)